MLDEKLPSYSGNTTISRLAQEELKELEKESDQEIRIQAMNVGEITIEPILHL